MIGDAIDYEHVNRVLLSVRSQITHYRDALAAGTVPGILHHGVYAGQLAGWAAALAVLEVDANFHVAYPYWTAARLTSLAGSLARIAAAVAPHVEPFLVGGCWNLIGLRALELSAADRTALAAAITAELG